VYGWTHSRQAYAPAAGHTFGLASYTSGLSTAVLGLVCCGLVGFSSGLLVWFYSFVQIMNKVGIFNFIAKTANVFRNT
jgi:hypothetical protein